MCIIAAKPAGVPMPSRDTIRTMWDGNRDGAGLMYVKDGKVRIEKGFMKYKDFAKVLDRLEKDLDLTATPVVMHFRITTHGGTKPSNCHPFPITDNITALGKPVCNTAIGVAHNGIIDIHPRKGISDTMEYIASQLAPLHRALPRFYENKHAMQLIANAITSKMCFLTKDGKIYTVGDFTKDEGILYSNSSYKQIRLPYRGGKFDYYGWDAWDGWTDDPCKQGADDALWCEPDDVAPLMWLQDGDIVLLPDGSMEEGIDYLLNDNNQVWMYDLDADCAVRVPGAEARTENLTPRHYDPESPDIDNVPVCTEATITM